MSTERTHCYEGLFLFPQAQAGDLKAAGEHISEMIARAEGELLALAKWDERRLAYEIKKQKRGIYLIAYFKAPGTKVVSIERDCNLSETVLRFILTRADHMTEEEMRARDDRESLRTEAALRSDDAPAAPEATPTPAAETAPAEEPVAATAVAEAADETPAAPSDA